MIQLDIPDITIKPYVRMTQKGMWSSPQAQEYLTSKANLAHKIKEAMIAQNIDMQPGQTSLYVAITVHVHTSQGHRADLDNILKAVLDSCNGIAFPDDRWVDEIDIIRKIGDQEHLSLSIDVKR